jgi:uncharacterized alkaline shock family protein YloU
MQDNLGSVRVAPGVLATIASLTALAVPGVARMSEQGVGRFVRRSDRPAAGVKLQLRDDQVYVDLFIVVERGVSMYDVAVEVQREVREAVTQMVGIPVREVNVFIQDVL